MYALLFCNMSLHGKNKILLMKRKEGYGGFISMEWLAQGLS